MHILLISPYFHPHEGGSQRYMEELHATLLANYKNVVVDVLCYNTDNSKPVEKNRGLTIYRVPCWQPLKSQFAVPNYIALAKILNKLFSKNHYDFINSNTRFFESSWWVPFVAKYFKTKSVLTDHCASHPVHKNKLVTFVSLIIDKYFVPLVFPFYTEIIVTNKATQKFVNSLSKKKTHVIYGGVETKFFKRNANKSRKILNKTFSSNDIVVTFVGRMIYSKGPQLLAEAARELIKKHKKVYFVFAGSGNLYPELVKKQNDRIIFTGPLDKKGVAQLLSKTDILVHPSLHHEGFPNVLLEAGAAGLAVLATPKGGTYEIINKNTGIIIKPTVADIKNKLEYLFDNKKKITKYGKTLQDWVEKNYDWKKITDDYKIFIDKNLV